MCSRYVNEDRMAAQLLVEGTVLELDSPTLGWNQHILFWISLQDFCMDDTQAHD